MRAAVVARVGVEEQLRGVLGVEKDIVEEEDLVKGCEAVVGAEAVEGSKGAVAHLRQVREALHAHGAVGEGDVAEAVEGDGVVVDDVVGAGHLALEGLEGRLAERAVVLVDAEEGVVGAQQVNQLEYLLAPLSAGEVTAFVVQTDGDEDPFIVWVCTARRGVGAVASLF